MRPAEFTNSGRRVCINGAEVTAHLSAVLVDKLIKRGLEVRDAEEIGLNVMDEVRRQYGGQNIYFPRDAKLKLSERDMQIFERYDRRELSIPDIVQQYGISIQWAYAIVRTVRDKLKKQRDAEQQDQRNKKMQRWSREN